MNLVNKSCVETGSQMFAVCNYCQNAQPRTISRLC